MVVPAADILLIPGSLRNGSTNMAALRTVQQVAPGELTTVLYGELARLPAFNPDDDHDPLHPVVADLRRRIASADAVLIWTPEYAGGLPGSFKNLLDWTVGGGEMYGKPVAWINVAAQGRGMNAHASLATVLGYVGASVIEPACQSIPVGREQVSSAGVIVDGHLRARITDVLQAIRNHLSAAGVQ